MPPSLIFIAFAVSVTVVAPVVATDFVHRDDMEVIALNIETGELKWTYKGPPLGFAQFEIYPGLLAVNPQRNTTGKSNPILLDPETGAVVNAETPDLKHLGKATRLPWMGAAVVLENGWKLESFGDGESKNLQFVDPKTSKGVWTVKLAEYNERVIATPICALFCLTPIQPLARSATLTPNHPCDTGIHAKNSDIISRPLDGADEETRCAD